MNFQDATQTGPVTLHEWDLLTTGEDDENRGFWRRHDRTSSDGFFPASAEGIAHDSEYYVLESQHSEQWAKDDHTVDAKLAAFQKKNGGKPPNILYILIDDIGFGDLGIPELNAIRGYKTPTLNQFADESMRFARMYTEPSCTPTRVAFMTGRHPFRNGMGDTAVDISGFGLAGKEVTLAEVLSETGYNTVHIGKWHMGDKMESWPNHQGFDFAAFPIPWGQKSRTSV